MTTIRVVPEMDLNRDGKVSLWELVASAMLIGGVTFGLLLLLVMTVSLFVEWEVTLKAAIRLVMLLLCVSALISAGVVMWRLFRYERGERKAQEEWNLEYDRKRFELEQIMGISEREDDTAWTNATQDRYARLFLQISYDQNRFVTRDEWKEKSLSEDAWNRINKLMQKHKIRKGRSRELQYETLAGSWGKWCEETLKSRQWVRSGDDLLKD